MDPIRPPSGPSAPQVAARVTPLGRGWMLLALEAGPVLRNPGLGIDLRLAGEDAEALQKGEVTPESLAQKAGHGVPQPPAGAVTVAFSPEAMRLSGQTGPARKSAAERAEGGHGELPPQVRARLRVLWIGAIVMALLVVVLIGTG